MMPSSRNLTGWFRSGKHKCAVKGLSLIALYHTDINGIQTPANYRICDKSEGKTKNDYFQEMPGEVYDWGQHPSWLSPCRAKDHRSSHPSVRRPLGFPAASIRRGTPLYLRFTQSWSQAPDTPATHAVTSSGILSERTERSLSVSSVA